MAFTDHPRQAGDRAMRRPRGRAHWARAGLVTLASSLACAFVAQAQPADPGHRGKLNPPATAAWQQLALHGLLVPLLEPDGELAWAQPNEVMPCRDSAEVRVDGRPVPPGQRLAVGKPIAVNFSLDDCWPLGGAGLGLWGRVEMTIVNEGPRVRAMVRPVGLSAAVGGARVTIDSAFVGVVSLAPAKVRP